MKLRMIVFTVFIAGCSHGTTSGGTAISSSSAGLNVQASGSTAAALICLGIAGAVNDGTGGANADAHSCPSPSVAHECLAIPGGDSDGPRDHQPRDRRTSTT